MRNSNKKKNLNIKHYNMIYLSALSCSFFQAHLFFLALILKSHDFFSERRVASLTQKSLIILYSQST